LEAAISHLSQIGIALRAGKGTNTDYKLRRAHPGLADDGLAGPANSPSTRQTSSVQPSVEIFAPNHAVFSNSRDRL
jgi:hypothetical protein